jgi:signal peptidase II
MDKKGRLKFIISITIIGLNIFIDQLSKFIVRREIEYDEIIHLIKNYLILTKVENTGAFLSAGNNLPEFIKIILLNVLPILVLLYGLWFLYKHPKISKLMQIGVCFLIGGGIGNIYDRIAYGSVTDFLHIDFVIFRTGIFNVADMSIMTGIGLLLLQSFKQKIKAKQLEVN